MKRSVPQAVRRVIRGLALGALLAGAIAPQSAVAASHPTARYHALADAIAMRSCALWAPGATSLSYRTAGRINADYQSYAWLMGQYRHFTQQQLPSWDAARKLCNKSHSVSSNWNSFDAHAEDVWLDAQLDALDDGLYGTKAGTPAHEIWLGYDAELHKLFTDYFNSHHYVLGVLPQGWSFDF